MNLRLLSKQLGIIAMLIGGTMLFSLPWAHPALGHRNVANSQPLQFETGGFVALLISIVCSFVAGGLLWRWGRYEVGHLYRKEAMAVVGLSWIMATLLGALPFYFSGTFRSPGVRLMPEENEAHVFDFGWASWSSWIEKRELSAEQVRAIQSLIDAGARGIEPDRMSAEAVESLRLLAEEDEDWDEALLFPGESGPPDPDANYRISWIRMGFSDALFESQSGFSTTGATVISELEDPSLISHAILFWRSSTHFLGGLGIIVLFVAILGQGSAGKALMRSEMPGPSKEGSQTRMQHTAWVFAAIYVGLTVALAVILKLLNLTWFDSLCHAFGTMATGGFSTYNSSVGHFNSAAIDYFIIVFMVLAGTNFTLLYLLLMRRPKALLSDVEWRTYMLVILSVTLLVILFGLASGDFLNVSSALRYGLFQVVAIITTTGYGTHDFDGWGSFGRGVLFLLMFVGGCAGSTGGGMKVIRHVLFLKILWLEVEQAFRPSVVRPLRLGGRPVEDPGLRKNILVYFGLILVIFVFSWMFLVTVEPEMTWGGTQEHKLIDSASGVAATLNNIGPGLGTVGATQNYGHFSPIAKILFTWLMMIGRLEIFVILVLFVPAFWRNQ